MKQIFRRSLSVLLALILLATASLPAFAYVDPSQTRSQIPVIRIMGDGNTIYDKDGNALSKLSKLFGNNGGSNEGALDRREVMESVANVLMPFLIEGIAFNNWEPYYENLQKEISELFGDIMLDENGEASNGSYPANLWRMETDKNTDKKGSKGYYGTYDYELWYDWRLDPLQTADELDDYIKCVKAATGAQKVSLFGNCLGTNIIFAYIAKYGLDDIYGVGLDAPVSMGAEPISESISGKFKIDGSAITRILTDMNYYGAYNISDFLIATIDLAEKSGALDTVVGAGRDLMYEKLVKGVTSAITLGTVVSFPGYWASVSVDDFDDAIEYVFGKEGGEKREKYAGLIKKVTNYNEKVKKHIPEMMEKMRDDEDIRLAVLVKYGFQLLPLCQSRNKIADSFVSAEYASFGATTGTIYEPLSDEYIDGQVKKGLGRYISPDRQIDASTCICPDYTWFAKGIRHVDSTDAESNIIMTVITSEKQLTVDDFETGQFMVYSNGTLYRMTGENCNTEAWVANEKEDDPNSLFQWLWGFLKSLFNWLPKVFSLIFSKIGQ